MTLTTKPSNLKLQYFLKLCCRKINFKICQLKTQKYVCYAVYAVIKSLWNSRSFCLDDFTCYIALSAIEDINSLCYWVVVLYYNAFYLLISLPRFLFLWESHFSLQVCCRGITCISGMLGQLWPVTLPAVSLFYLSLRLCTWWLWNFRWDCLELSIWCLHKST